MCVCVCVSLIKFNLRLKQNCLQECCWTKKTLSKKIWIVDLLCYVQDPNPGLTTTKLKCAMKPPPPPFCLLTLFFSLKKLICTGGVPVTRKRNKENVLYYG